LADRFAAFLAGARLAGEFAGARRTALLADRFALFLAGARFAACVAGERLTILGTGPPGDVSAEARRAGVVVDFPAVFLSDVLGAGRESLPLTMAFRVLLGAKRTPFDAAILTGAPVCGLRPMRAPRCVGLKDPNPETTTRRPPRTSLTTAWTNALTASSDSRFVSDVVALIASIRSDLFTRRPPPCSGIPSIKEGFGVKVKHLRC
jgi:putative acetyltransferase